MNIEIDAAIKKMTDVLDAGVNADGALKYSQAVLNLAHAQATIAVTERENPKNE